MRLGGDIGGTSTRLTLAGTGEGRFERRFESPAFPAFDALLARFLAEARTALGEALRIDAACFGVAGPVAHDRVQVTNLPWEIEGRALAVAFGIARVALVNDFVANAHGIAELGPADLATLQPGEPVEDAPRLLIGAGTGLGVCLVVRSAGGDRIVPSEGGHVAFAPADDEQAALWRSLRARLGRVELEHLVSGPGLVRIYEHLRESGRHPVGLALERELAAGDPAAVIARHALEHADPLAAAALDLFIACYGAAAGDHALTAIARGGVYVAAFNDKSALAVLARTIPVHVVLNERLGLLGAARIAATL